MNCRETLPLLPLFLDGELEARQMRAVALHSTRCAPCEEELRHIERLQELVATQISAQVDEVDLGAIWAGVAPRLGNVAEPWYQRAAGRFEGARVGWRPWMPMTAALAAAAVLALVFWQKTDLPAGMPVKTASSVDNSAILDSMQSNVDSVAMLHDDETNTMVLWITDDAATVDDLGDLP